MKENLQDRKILPETHQLWQQVKDYLLERMKELVEAIIEAERTHYIESQGGRRNGYWSRSLESHLGKIEGLKIGRVREGGFYPQILRPYARRAIELDELIISLYESGISTRKISSLLRRFYGASVSASVISKITERVSEKLQQWRRRPLPSKMRVLYIDAGFFHIRRDTVEREAVYFVLGVDEEGRRQIVDFALAPVEAATLWKEILEGLQARGLKRVEFVVADGLSGLREAVAEVFPEARFQLCWLHKVKNLLLKVRKRDRASLAYDLKLIYKAEGIQAAKEAFSLFKLLWSGKYPGVVKSLEKDIDVLLQFMKAPPQVWDKLYTTNMLERTIKEIKRRTKTIESFPTPESLEKLVYLLVRELNERWKKRRIKGFSYWFMQEERKNEFLTQNS